MWQSGIVAKGQNKSATSLGDCGRGEINKLLSECDRAVAQAGSRSEGSEGCRED